MPPPVEVLLGGAPSEEEVVAIVAAVDAAWPRPVVLARTEEPLSLRWRFSGRWWSRPTISRRDRPWVGPQR